MKDECKALSLFGKIRVLETSFTTLAGERKTHYLLTNTPREVPMAEEKYQLGIEELSELFNSVSELAAENKRLKKEIVRLRRVWREAKKSGLRKRPAADTCPNADGDCDHCIRSGDCKAAKTRRNALRKLGA